MATVHKLAAESHQVVDTQVVGSRLVDTLAVDSHQVVDSRLAAHMGVAPRQVCPVVVEHSRHTDWVGWGLAPG